MDKIDELCLEIRDLTSKEKITVDHLRVFIPDYTRLFKHHELLDKEELVICALESYVGIMQQHSADQQRLLHRLSFGCDDTS